MQISMRRVNAIVLPYSSIAPIVAGIESTHLTLHANSLSFSADPFSMIPQLNGYDGCMLLDIMSLQLLP